MIQIIPFNSNDFMIKKKKKARKDVHEIQLLKKNTMPLNLYPFNIVLDSDAWFNCCKETVKLDTYYARNTEHDGKDKKGHDQFGVCQAVK